MSAKHHRDAAGARDLAIGYLAAGAAVTIWAGWIVATRAAVADQYGVSLTPLDIALLRFAAPALIFAPFWLRAGLWPRTVRPLVLIGMFGWGAPFAVFAAIGLQTTSAAAMAAMVPGMMPLYVAVFAGLVWRERFTPARRIGLLLIGLAAAALLGPEILAGGGTVLSGAPWLMAAAASWAAFALSFSRSGLGPVAAAGLVGAQSVVVAAPLALIFGSSLPDLSAGALAWQIFAQGVLSGAVSIAAYALAIDRLGASRAASLSALVPVLAALIGWIWLGEALGPLEIAAIAAASLGVAFVNGAFGTFERRA